MNIVNPTKINQLLSSHPLPFSERSYEIPILPMRALEIVKKMLTYKERLHEWAKEVLGKCAPDIGSGQGEASVFLAGQNSKIGCV